MAHACGVPIGAVQKRRTGARRARDDDSPSGHRCPRCHGRALDAVAYAHLLGLHLGDGHMVRVRAVHRLSIFCDNAWPGLIDEAARSMALTMPASSVSRRQRQGCIEVMSYSLHRPCLFPQHGPGRKHEREIKLAPDRRRSCGRIQAGSSAGSSIPTAAAGSTGCAASFPAASAGTPIPATTSRTSPRHLGPLRPSARPARRGLAVEQPQRAVGGAAGSRRAARSPRRPEILTVSAPAGAGGRGDARERKAKDGGFGTFRDLAQRE